MLVPMSRISANSMSRTKPDHHDLRIGGRNVLSGSSERGGAELVRVRPAPRAAPGSDGRGSGMDHGAGIEFSHLHGNIWQAVATMATASGTEADRKP